MKKVTRFTPFGSLFRQLIELLNHRQFSRIALFGLLTMACVILSAQRRYHPDEVYLTTVKTEMVHRDDSLQLAQVGIRGIDSRFTHHYEVRWGDHARRGDSATIFLYTEVTGDMWQQGSLRQRGNTIYLNIEHHYKGLLAAVAAPTIFEFRLKGLKHQPYKIKFGEFILCEEHYSHVTRRWKPNNRMKSFWL